MIDGLGDFGYQDFDLRHGISAGQSLRCLELAYLVSRSCFPSSCLSCAVSPFQTPLLSAISRFEVEEGDTKSMHALPPHGYT